MRYICMHVHIVVSVWSFGEILTVPIYNWLVLDFHLVPHSLVLNLRGKKDPRLLC